MYRRRSSPNLILLIFLGAVSGIIFLLYDNRDSFLNSPVTTPTVAPTAVASTAIFTPVSGQPTATFQPVEDTRPRINIPVMGVNAPIIQVFLDGTSWDVSGLGRDVGHLQGTAWFDTPGNVVLSGHVELRDGHGGAFRYLEDLATGERILISFQGEERVYVVSENFKVEPDDLTPLYPTDTDRLTLITCGDYNFLADSYNSRVVVVAERVS